MTSRITMFSPLTLQRSRDMLKAKLRLSKDRRQIHESEDEFEGRLVQVAV
jgi:hypothetical protein